MKKILSKLLEKRWIANTFTACLTVVFTLLLLQLPNIFSAIGRFFGMIESIIVGAVMAYLLTPIYNFFYNNILGFIKNKLRDSLALALTFMSIILAIYLLSYLIVPSVMSTVNSISTNLPKYQENLEKTLDNLIVIIPGFSTEALNNILDEILTKGTSVLEENLGNLLNASIGIGKSFFQFIIGFFIAVYLIAGKKGLKEGSTKLLQSAFTDEFYNSITRFFSRCNDILLKYIGFNLLDSLVVAVINAVLMLIFRMPFVALVSVIVGVTNLAPTFGPIVGAVFGAVFLLINNPIQALLFLIITIIIQTFDGYILKPRLFGGALGVPALGILITIIIGGGMFGMVGILLAIPFAAIITIIYDEIILPALLNIKDSYVKNKD